MRVFWVVSAGGLGHECEWFWLETHASRLREVKAWVVRGGGCGVWTDSESKLYIHKKAAFVPNK